MPVAPTQPEPEPSSPATTAPDASAAVVHVLERSRSAPVPMRALADVVRAAIAIGIGAIAWGRGRPALAALLDGALADWARDLVLAAAPLVIGALLMTVACRLGARRFAHPLRRRRT